MIVLESVSKEFPGKNGRQPVPALDSVNLRVTRGELVTVIGPSGSGKSTLLFTIGAMMRPTAGDVTVGGTRIYDLPAGKRAKLRQSRFGFVFQTFNLLPYLTCCDNVALPAILAGTPRTAARERAAAMLERRGASRWPCSWPWEEQPLCYCSFSSRAPRSSAPQAPWWATCSAPASPSLRTLAPAQPWSGPGESPQRLLSQRSGLAWQR